MIKKKYKVGDIVTTEFSRYTSRSKDGRVSKVLYKIPVTGKIKRIKLNGPKVYIITEGKLGDFPTRNVK